MIPSSKVEDKIASFHSLLGFWSQHILTLRNTVPVHIWGSWKATGFEWVVARKSSAAQPLGPISSRRPYSAGGIGMGKNSAWILWQAPVRESQSSGVWSKAMTPAGESYALLEKQPLAYTGLC